MNERKKERERERDMLVGEVSLCLMGIIRPSVASIAVIQTVIIHLDISTTQYILLGLLVRDNLMTNRIHIYIAL